MLKINGNIIKNAINCLTSKKFIEILDLAKQIIKWSQYQNNSM